MSSGDEVNDGIPAYLRNLEELLSGSTSSIQETISDVPLESVVVDTPQPPLNLSNIGFGSMFTTANNSTVSDAPTEKVKFMLVSTHLQQFTGYAKVAHGILNELAIHPWIQLMHYGFQRMVEVPQGFRPYPPGVDVIDAVS